MKRYKYNGKERDTESGLDYYGARYYASWLCRFISVDPLKDDYPLQNSFAYAANSPVTMIDVNGESPGGGGEGGEDECDPKSCNSGYQWSSSSNSVSTSLASPKGYTTTNHLNNNVSKGYSVSDLNSLIASFEIELDTLNTHEFNLTMKGVSDALWNSNTIGLYDLVNDPQSDYSGSNAQAYLRGRIIGDAMAMLMGFDQISAGGAAASFSLASGPAAPFVATLGGVVALHGAASSATATIDLIKSLQLYHSFSADSSGNSDGNSESSGSSSDDGFSGTYEPNPKHGTKNSGKANKAPDSPEEMLKKSLELPGNTTRRISANKTSGEFAIFDEHSPGKFHGHARAWDELSQNMKNVLIKNKFVNRKGKFLN